jgi:hypothetical protein
MTPETIETIREVLETEIETSACAMDSAKRNAEYAEYRARRANTDASRFRATQYAADAQKQLDAETERHQCAKTALDEFNAAYPKGNS